MHQVLHSSGGLFCCAIKNTHNVLKCLRIEPDTSAVTLLNWTGEKPSKTVGIHANTITRIESGDYPFRETTAAKLQSAFENEGVQFINANGGGVGVRLTKP